MAKYTIHLKSGDDVDSIIQHLKLVKFLNAKSYKTNWQHDKHMIKFESSNPGVITHIKRKFGDHILGVFSDKHGAGQYRRPTSHLSLLPPQAKPLTPMQVAAASHFPKPGPTIRDKVVAIIELGGAFNPKDVLNYCKALDVPMPRLYYHLIDGAKEVVDGVNGADGEVSLDIDVVAAVAPGCKILVVFAPNTTNGFIDAVAGMTTYALKPDAVSISWGMPEKYWDPAGMEALDNAIQSCVNKGINVFVAAGDDGSSGGAGGSNVDFPSSSSHSISCGGTKLILNPDGSRYSEVVWNEMLSGEGATGGGVSKVYSGRQVPDIAGNADPNSGYIVDIDGTQGVIGGTSAVAPLYAALTAILASNTPVGNLKNVLYANPSICFDVTNGNNGAFKAGPGYDMCSGLGVVDGTKLLNVLKPTAVQKVMKWLSQPIGQLFIK